NAVVALTIPSYETIREDLEQVVERNARISQLVALEKTVEQTLDKYGAKAKSRFAGKQWQDMKDLSTLVQKYGVSYAAYHQFKIDSVIHSIADIVCSAGGIGRPEQQKVIRELVTEWMRTSYGSFQEQMQLLLDADIDYRLRKISFVLRRARLARRIAASTELKDASKKLKEAYDKLYALRKWMRDQFYEPVQQLRADQLTEDVLQRLALAGDDRKKLIDELLEANATTAAKLKQYIGTLGGSIQKISDELWKAVSAIPELREAYEAFENYDMIIYPIISDGAVDEAVEV